MANRQRVELRIRRSYERNLGYARFWGGAALGVLAAIFAFLSRPPECSDGQQSVMVLEVLRAILGLSAGSSIGLAGVFWLLYRSDDSELAVIEESETED